MAKNLLKHLTYPKNMLRILEGDLQNVKTRGNHYSMYLSNRDGRLFS